jgi:hypothetical protein
MKKIFYAGVLIGVSSLFYVSYASNSELLQKNYLEPYCVTLRNPKTGVVTKYNFQANSPSDALQKAEKAYSGSKCVNVVRGSCR